jgi:uncharacterized membrane protein YccF (DUF307 family)
VALCLTVTGIPFGIANFKLVTAAFWPLGRQVADLDTAPPVAVLYRHRQPGTIHSTERPWK